MPLPLAGPPGFLPLHTLLEIIPLSGGQGLYLTPYSARGLSQELKQISSGQQNIRRTVIGTTVNLTPPWFQQYSTVITCSDTNTPAINATWRGQNFEVHCAAELDYPVGGTPARSEVTGSSRQEGHTMFYRPILYMMLIDFDVTFREYDGVWNWRLELEENALP
jgi:hypothetical protein